MKSPEQRKEPGERLEALTLRRLGYSDEQLDQEILAPNGRQVIAREFLDAYGDSPQRQHTEEFMSLLQQMDEAGIPKDNPHYQKIYAYVSTSLTNALQGQLGNPKLADSAGSIQ